MGVGGKAPLLTVKNKSELIEAYSNYKDYIVIGSGTNILVSDDLSKIKFLQVKNHSIENRNGKVKVGAGVIWDKFVKYAVENQLQGIECLSGIPGTVGAAPIQNIGAYGQEIAQVVEKIDCFDVLENKFITLNNKDCNFSYRDSLFKRNKDRFIVFNVYFRFRHKNKSTISYKTLVDILGKDEIKLSKIRNIILQVRKDKFGDINGKGTAGSFFKNPIVEKPKLNKLLKINPEMPYFEYDQGFKLYGGWLIEKAGWKGKNMGNVSVSNKNALVLKNSTGKATANEIYKVSKKIIKDVKDKYGIELEREVRLIGF